MTTVDTLHEANVELARTGSLKRARRQHGAVGGMAVAGASNDPRRAVAAALLEAVTSGRVQYVVAGACGFVHAGSARPRQAHYRVEPGGHVHVVVNEQGEMRDERQMPAGAVADALAAHVKPQRVRP